ncbi:MAG: hypothetical protein WD894_14395 [Pirellulales bacterium]
MHNEEITIDGTVYTIKLLRTGTELRTMWACQSCGCGECCPTNAPESVAVQLAKAIVEEHHRLHHAVRRAAPKVHKLSWQGA